MDQCFPQLVVVAFTYFIGFIITISVFIIQSDGRYLRPSDHGLAYQNTSNPTKEDIPEMLLFFNDGKTTSFQSTTPLPEARNLSTSSDPAATWWSKNRKSRDSTGKNHVREVLLVTSLVCGLTGIVLLVVSAFIFLYQHRKQRPEAEMAEQRSLSTPVTSSALALALPSGVEKKSSK